MIQCIHQTHDHILMHVIYQKSGSHLDNLVCGLDLFDPSKSYSNDNQIIRIIKSTMAIKVALCNDKHVIVSLDNRNLAIYNNNVMIGDIHMTISM